MGILGAAKDFVLGSGGSSDIKGASLQTKQQKKLLDSLISQLMGTPLDQVEGKAYEGERIAGLGENEELIQSLLGGTIEGIPQQFDAIQAALAPLLSGDPSDFDEYFTQTIQDPLLETFNEDVLPTLSRTFGPTDFFGSDRFGANVDATENLTDALTRERARTGFETRESALDRSLQAADISRLLPGGEVNALQGTQTLSQIPRGLEQAGLDVEFEEFLRTQVAEKDKRIQQILATLGLGAKENIVDVRGSSPGLLQSFLGSDAGADKLAGLLPF